jgi:hypothetical protein
MRANSADSVRVTNRSMCSASPCIGGRLSGVPVPMRPRSRWRCYGSRAAFARDTREITATDRLDPSLVHPTCRAEAQRATADGGEECRRDNARYDRYGSLVEELECEPTCQPNAEQDHKLGNRLL